MNTALVNVHQWLFGRQSSRRSRLWLGLSIFVGLIYAGLALKVGLGADVVQDDARQHIFWMQRFLDPTLFPDDWIADYYQSVAPPGVSALYRLATRLGLHPYQFSKLLPSILGGISTFYAFRLTTGILPLPLAGFIATVMLNQNLWMQDSLTSATARAFLIPGLLAVMNYVARESRWGTWLAIAFLTLFYPSYALIASGLLVLQLIHWSKTWHCLQARSLRIHLHRDRLVLGLVGLGVVFVLLLPQVLGGDPRFGPVISRELAQTLPEFQPGGRTTFWEKTAWDYWFNGSRSGLKLSMAITSPLSLLGLFLPALCWWPRRLPLTQAVTPAVQVLGQVMLVATVLFLAAHALLFELYLPSRYTQHSYRLAIAIAAGIALTILLDGALRGLMHLKSTSQQWVGLVAIGAVAIGQLLYPQLTMSNFPWTAYERAAQPDLYAFLAAQPSETLVAGIARETDNIPTFAARRVLSSREHSIPYHVGYFLPLRQRTLDVIQAQYSPDLAEVQRVIEAYNVDFWLLDTNAFELSYPDLAWIRQFTAETQTALAPFRAGETPAIAHQIPACTAFANPAVILLDAQCLSAASPSPPEQN